MTYSLFIDDERFPAAQPTRDGNFTTMNPAEAVDHDAEGRPWVIARTLDEVRDLLETRGAPTHASFDHDLGEDQASGADIAQAMVSADQISRHGPGGLADLQAQGFTFRFPDGFTYTVHSMNSVGGPGINQILGRYLAFLREN